MKKYRVNIDLLEDEKVVESNSYEGAGAAVIISHADNNHINITGTSHGFFFTPRESIVIYAKLCVRLLEQMYGYVSGEDIMIFMRSIGIELDDLNEKMKSKIQKLTTDQLVQIGFDEKYADFVINKTAFLAKLYARNNISDDKVREELEQIINAAAETIAVMNEKKNLKLS